MNFANMVQTLYQNSCLCASYGSCINELFSGSSPWSAPHNHRVFSVFTDWFKLTYAAEYVMLMQAAAPSLAPEAVVLSSGAAVIHTASGPATGFDTLKDFNAHVSRTFPPVKSTFVRLPRAGDYATPDQLKAIIDEIRSDNGLGLFVYFQPAHHCVVLEPTGGGFRLIDVRRVNNVHHQHDIVESQYKDLVGSIRSNGGRPFPFFNLEWGNAIGEIAKVGP